MVFNDEDLSYRNGDSSTVGVTDWLLLDAIGLLGIIPVVGTIAAVVFYVVIAATRDSAPSVQSRIIVNLIWLGVSLVALAVVSAMALAGAVDLGGLLPMTTSVQTQGA